MARSKTLFGKLGQNVRYIKLKYHFGIHFPGRILYYHDAWVITKLKLCVLIHSIWLRTETLLVPYKTRVDSHSTLEMRCKQQRKCCYTTSHESSHCLVNRTIFQEKDAVRISLKHSLVTFFVKSSFQRSVTFEP